MTNDAQPASDRPLAPSRGSSPGSSPAASPAASPSAGPGPISVRVDRLRRGEDPQLIARTPSGWAILANQQPGPITGCCMLLPDPVVPSVNDLDEAARAVFMTDLVRLGDAVTAVTGAERINYLILCNQVPELHGHVVPRFAGEDPAARRLGPFEAYDFPGARRADALGLDRALLERLRDAMPGAAFAPAPPIAAD